MSQPTTSPWVNPFPKDDPRSLLFRYQWNYWQDTSRFKVALWSRQTGKDFTSTGEAVQDCMTRKIDWMIAAPSERQSLESLEKAKAWAQAFNYLVHDYSEAREGGGETLLKSAEIVFENGSKIRAVPGKPDTVRGMSSCLLLTEFGFFEKPDETWRAIVPSITNPLKGGQKVVRIITTPNGIGNMLHEIWMKQGGRVQWSKHKVTIHDAVADGLPVDIEELREAFGDPEGWAQEFECEFLDAASVLMPYELIAAIENPNATVAAPQGFWEAKRGPFPIDLGIDFGRKNDLTVCWALEDVHGFGLTREVLELAKMPVHEQLEILRPRIQRARRVAFDYTGPGIGLGDLLVKEFREWNPEKHLYGKIELVTFTAQRKCELYPALRSEAEKRMIGIPVSRAVREDLHSVSRVVTKNGHITYTAPHSPDGHADRATGAVLAIRAKSWANSGSFAYQTVKKTGAHGRRGTRGMIG